MAPIGRGARSASAFNSTLETGIRALVVLDAFYPRGCDLWELTWLDHLVVHTADLADDAPESLHPALPNRVGEIVVRRPLIERSLRLMQRVHLVDVLECPDGIEFSASDESRRYLDLLQAPYMLELKRRAEWLAERLHGFKSDDLRALMEERTGRWTAEFRVEETPGRYQP